MMQREKIVAYTHTETMEPSSALALGAYILLLIATVPQLPASTVPVAVVVAAYIFSVVRVATSESNPETSRRCARAARLCYVTYFLLKLVCPLPWHWYDVLGVLVVVLPQGSQPWHAIVAAYYVASIAAYAKKGQHLQVTARSMLLIASLMNAQSLKVPADEEGEGL